MKRAFIVLLAIFLSGCWQICVSSEEQSVEKELEVFRLEYENAVRERDIGALLEFFDEELKNQLQGYWQFLLAGGWGRLSYLDDKQSEDYSGFKLLMDICQVKENEVIAVLAHDTGIPFVNRYFLVSKYGPDVYRLIKKNGQWKITGHVNPADLYDVQHHDMKVQIFPDTGEMEVEQILTAKRLSGDGKFFFSYFHEGMNIESIESPQGALDFSQLASTVAVKFKEKPSSDIIQLYVKYRGEAAERFVNQKFPKGRIINVQRIEPHMAIVREENKWYLQTDPATARIAITAPKGFKAVSSRGVLTSTEEGESTITYVWDVKEPPSGTSSGYGFLACDDWNVRSKKVGEIKVSVYLREGNKSDPEEIMKNAEEIVSVFNELFGPTLPNSFALIDAPFGWNRPNYVPLFGGGRVSVHEMAHYWWIGAFKSVEQRAFDWFTEGFATFSETLYAEHKNGNPAYHARMWRNITGYLMNLDSKIDPNDPGKTLLKVPDAPTRYSKGACVLHALRFVVGEDNFLEILKKFIAEYRGEDISVSKFRNVSEKVYGKELGWFLDQWLERAGLPDYKLIVDRIDSMSDGKIKVTGRIEQLSELYKMPLEIVIKMENKQKSERIWVEEQITPFEIIVPQEPISVELDPSHWVIRYDIKESPTYQIGEFVLKQKWGQKSSEKIASKYLKEWLEQLNDQFALKRIGHALYDVKRYEEALDVFKKVSELAKEVRNSADCAIFLLWQGHMLDLLGRREEALSVYQKVVDMNVTDSQWSSGMYGLRYKPSISGYAAERMKEPFKRLENRYKD